MNKTNKPKRGKIRDMFNVFIEWWLIKKIRHLYDKASYHLIVNGNIGGEPVIPKDVFLIGVVKLKWFGIFPKSKKRLAEEAIKYKKILQQLGVRAKPLIEETTFEIHSLKELETNPFFNDDNLKKWGIESRKDVKFVAGNEDRKKVVIKLTGEGYNFTFGVATTEFVREYVNTWQGFLVLMVPTILAIWGSEIITEIKIKILNSLF